MWKCMDCDFKFDNPEKVTENYGTYAGLPANMTYAVCPHCGSEDIQKSELGDVYGTEIFPGETYYELGEDIVAEENLEEYIADSKREV